MMPTSWKSQYADWDEMVFADREKSYGAFELRKRYPRHLLAGLGGAVLLGILMIAWPKLNHLFAAEAPVTGRIVEGNLTTIDLPPVEEPQAKEIQPPPPPPEAPKLRQLASLIPDPTEAEDLDPEEDATIHRMDSLLAAPNIGLDNVEGRDEQMAFTNIGTGEEDIPQVIVEPSIPPIDVFQYADQEPTPINMAEIQRSISFPQMARNANIYGSVVFRVLVGPDGSYREHRVINSSHPLLTQAIEPHIGNLQFSPAIQGGKPIFFWVNIPFNFKLID